MYCLCLEPYWELIKVGDLAWIARPHGTSPILPTTKMEILNLVEVVFELAGEGSIGSQLAAGPRKSQCHTWFRAVAALP